MRIAFVLLTVLLSATSTVVAFPARSNATGPFGTRTLPRQIDVPGTDLYLVMQVDGSSIDYRDVRAMIEAFRNEMDMNVAPRAPMPPRDDYNYYSLRFTYGLTSGSVQPSTRIWGRALRTIYETRVDDETAFEVYRANLETPLIVGSISRRHSPRLHPPDSPNDPARSTDQVNVT